MNTIYFYSTTGQHGYMSNFYRSPIMVDEKLYSTSEHYFQSMKVLDPNTAEYIRNLSTPSQAAAEGRKRSNKIHSNWEQIKRDVMRKAIHAKFSQYPDLAQKLLSTGNAILVEHTTKDSYWADGGDGSGQNWLGKILIEERDHLKNASK